MPFRPPSYDPSSPSYDPCAASPCNPFPSMSPFATFSFSPPLNDRSGLAFEMDTNPDFDPPPQQSVQAHSSVLARIPPPHSAPALRRTKPCRFYLSQTGCKSGRWCNFKHPVGAGAGPDGDADSGSIAALRAAAARSRGDPNDPAIWENIPDIRDLDPNWGKKSDDEVHPKFRTQPCRNYLLGLCRYGDKCQFIHAPGLFAPGAVESLPVSPLPAPVPLSMWGDHPGVGVSPSETSGKSEQMSLFYRTKPCKFFDISGTCPHGPTCKFIHDPKKASSPSSVLSWADDDRELDFTEAPRFPSIDVDEHAMHDMTNNAGNRRRPRDTDTERERERERAAGIYKPLWRVVGGGVKIGKIADKRIDSDGVADDAILQYQPSDARDTSSFVPADIFTPTPTLTPHNHNTPASPLDLTFTPFDPAQYPPHALLRAPSGPLDITMGHLEDITSASPARKRRVVTGADLMRGLSGGERDKEKPRLTIAVPAMRTAAGDDVLDWGDDDDDVAQEDQKAPRRTRSTPPTPRSSASYLEVPVMPRMSVESP